MEQTKTCLVCKIDKPLSEFNKHKSKLHGVQSECRLCISNYHKMDRLNHRQKRLDRDKNWRKNNLQYFRDYNKHKNHTDPDFKMIKSLRYETWRIFKSDCQDKDLPSEEILGVNYEEARKRLFATMPEGKTMQDFLNGDLEIDHKIPVDWFKKFYRKYGRLTKELLKEMGSINNLQLLPKEENQLKKNRYGHGPNNEIILYEDWVKTRQVPTQSH